MGLTEDPLLHTAHRWYLSRVSFTPNHPRFGIGIAAWMEGVAALREGLLPDGWTRSDERNYALVVDPGNSIAINVATGDSGTGRPNANVSNRAPKGIATADAISANQAQLELPLPVPALHAHGDDGPMTWFLLLHQSTTEVRCELSLPSQISEDGRITSWQERIMLPTTPLDDAELEIESLDTADFVIDVKLKA